MSTTVLGMSVTGWLFFLSTGALFLWGLWIGWKGIMADMPAFHEGGHAPRSKGTFDPHHHQAA